MYAKELSKNVSMLNAIKKAFRAGMPTVAECGGFMYLHTYIRNICDDNDEKNNADTQNKADIQNDMNKSKLVGALDGGCHFKGKLVRFGYIELAEKHSNFLPPNEKIKAHEFHYYDSTDNGADCIATKPATGRSYDCVISHDNYWLGFPHLYYPSNPHFAESLVRKAYEYRRNKKENSYKYFKNTDCKYFPCHKGLSDDFNCLFCYCPMYSIQTVLEVRHT